MSATFPAPSFPDTLMLARAFFEEGIRHLEDAHILHKSQRYPAAIASAMKAAEFGVKSVIILDGAMGWWDKIFTTHSPLSDINALPFFQHHALTLNGYKRTLVADMMEMEKLAPVRPGSSKNAFDFEVQKNAEYPFLAYQIDPVSGSSEFRLQTPSQHFLEAASEKYCRIAWDLLTAITTSYLEVRNWGLATPASF